MKTVSAVNHFKELSIHNVCLPNQESDAAVNHFKELSIHNALVMFPIQGEAVNHFKELSIHNTAASGCCFSRSYK